MTSTHSHDENCLFCKIVAGKIPSKKIYEDGEILAFHDIHPIAPVHFLMIPKKHIESLNHVLPEDATLLARMVSLAPQLAAEQGCRPGREGGFRLLTNTGVDGGQEVFHLHLHIMGGERPWRKG